MNTSPVPSASSQTPLTANTNDPLGTLAATFQYAINNQANIQAISVSGQCADDCFKAMPH